MSCPLSVDGGARVGALASDRACPKLSMVVLPRGGKNRGMKGRAYLALPWLLVIACSDEPDAVRTRSFDERGFGEQDFIEKEVATLENALAAKDETKILVGCMVVAGKGLARRPVMLQRRIERLCYVEAPRVHLELAIAAATKARAEHADLPESFVCAQLLVSDALKAMAKAPAPDPGVKKLADDYEKLCPEAVAKIRARSLGEAPPAPGTGLVQTHPVRRT